jgi:hypothetical protein
MGRISRALVDIEAYIESVHNVDTLWTDYLETI